MKKWALGVVAAAVLACGVNAFGQDGDGAAAPAFKNPDPQRYLFEDALRPGMKGYGLTVMHGGTIEKFQIEIVDVMKNMEPDMNAILVRCSGLNLEHTGIIAGMSGSPVFIDGKMIGAIAFGWEGSKDPIGGVQPIRQMLSIPIPAEQPKDEHGIFTAQWTGRWGPHDTSVIKAYGATRLGWSQLITRMGGKQPSAAGAADLHVGQRNASLRPLASPLMVAGASDQGMAFLQSAFAGSGLVPVASGSAGSTLGGVGDLGGAADIKPGEIKLEPGSSIAIPLLTGDFDLSAIGTVTEVYNGHVYAFGHAMEAEGPSRLPIATGYIFTIMPTLQQAFKMGSSFQPAGALITDEQTGIVGTVGAKPNYVPLNITVSSSNGLQHRQYHYQLAVHPKFTPEILGAALLESLTAQEKMPKDFTTRITGSAKFAGATVKMDMLATNDTFNPAEPVVPVAMLLDNPWQSLELQGIDLEAKVEFKNRSAEIKSISVSQTVVAPGEDIVSTVELQPWNGEPRKVKLKLTVPKDTPDGDYELAVGSSQAQLEQDTQYFPQRFEPDNVQDLVHDLQRILDYKDDQLYASLLLDLHGVAQDGKEFHNMPRTRVAMYATEKRGDAQPVFNVVSTTTAADAVVPAGGETFHITVDKDAQKRYFTAKPGQQGNPGQKTPANPLMPPTAPSPGPSSQP